MTNNRNKAALILVFVIGFLAYLPVLTLSFVNLDDASNLARFKGDEGFTSKTLKLALFTPNVGHYQPTLAALWFFIAPLARLDQPLPQSADIAKIATLAPAVFHLINLLVHMINMALVWLVLTRLNISRTAAALGALVFALHPTQVESVAWISGLGGMLCSGFLLASLYFYITFLKETKRGSLSYKRSLFYFALALLTKPLAMTFPLIPLVVSVFFFGHSIKKSMTNLIPFGVVIIPAFLVSLATQADAPKLFSSPILQRPFVALDAFAFYCKRILSLAMSPIDYGRRPDWVLLQANFYSDLTWFYVTVLPIACLLIWFLLKKDNQIKKNIAVIFAFFLVPILPVLGFLTFLYQTVSTVSDRYLYLPMLALAYTFAWLWEVVFRRFGRFEGSSFLLTALLLTGLLGPAVSRQIPVWRNSISLFETCLKLNPKSFLAYNNLGSYYEEFGNAERSLQNYLKSAEIFPRVEPLLRAGILLTDLNRFDDAAIQFDRVLDHEPNNPMALQNLRFCYQKLGKTAKLDEITQRLQSLSNKNPQ